MPTEAKKQTAEGAAAFAEYYFELIEYTTVTNDPGPIERATSKKCQLCIDSIIIPAKKNAKGGGWNSGGAYDTSIASAELIDNSRGLVAFSYTQSKLTAYNSDGRVFAVQPASKEPVVGSISLTYGDAWDISMVSIAKS